MKKLFFFLVLLIGLSQNLFSQCSVNIEVPFNENGTAMLFASCTNPQAYAWDNGGNMSFRQISASGTYKVTVTCTNGEMSEAIINVTVNGSTVGGGCSFNITETKNCNMNKLQVTDCPDCVAWCWNTGAKTSSIDVSNIGTYTVTVTGAGGCTSVASKNVTEIKTANVSVSGNSKVCSGEKTILTANGGVSYIWNTGNPTSSVNVPKGNYSVTATDSNGCTASVNASVNEFPISIAPMVTPTINTDGTVTLTSSSPSGNMWSNGATSQSITPATSGIYTLKVKDNNGCYSASSCPSAVAIKTVTVINEVEICPLHASFMHEVTGKQVAFKNTATGDPTGQLWLFGDGTSSNELNPVHEYSNDGTYEVKLFIFKGPDQSMITGKIFINTKTGNGGGGNATCPAMASFMYQLDDTNVHFMNTSSGDGLLSYLWDFGDGTSSTQKHPVHQYAYGKYKVTLYVYTVTGFISASQMIYVVNQGVLNGTVCDSLLIKASNGMKNGEAILPSQISSQTKLVLEHPGARDWSWSPTGQATNWSLAKYNVGKHHFYVSYFVNNQKQCSVFDYEILGGGLTNTDDAENRSREEKGDINVYPNPTDGPIQIDISGMPAGPYFIQIVNEKGQTVKKVIKQ